VIIMMEEEEDEDEVLRELDVFVSDNNACSLLQFPLRPIYADTPTITTCQFKPLNKKFNMDVKNETTTGLQLHTSSVVCPNSNLCAGVIRNGELHLTALNDVYQMRPSFDNVDFDDEIDIIENKDEEKSAAIQQVHVKPKESERARATKEQSYSHMKKKEEEESFRGLIVHSIESEESSGYFESIYYDKQKIVIDIKAES
jgi:hypothetical protein